MLIVPCSARQVPESDDPATGNRENRDAENIKPPITTLRVEEVACHHLPHREASLQRE